MAGSTSTHEADFGSSGDDRTTDVRSDFCSGHYEDVDHADCDGTTFDTDDDAEIPCGCWCHDDAEAA